jgi:large subunit ribosomal protein L25
MDKITLQAESRPTAGRHALRELRAAAGVPAVVYGAAFETQNVAINARDLHRALMAAGTGLIELHIGEGAPVQVLAREVQRDPIRRKALHVDFMAVSMTEKLRVDVPIVAEGIAPAMSRPDLVMIREMDAIEVECLAVDIPRHLVANIADLKTADDSIYVRDLVVPPGVKVLVDGSHVVISLTISRGAVEETVEGEEAATVAEPEVVTKGKKEEEEAAAKS